MPDQAVTFGIDDSKTVDENLDQFARKLAELDPSLASVLTPILVTFSNSDSVDLEKLRTDLYAATAPNETTDSSANGESE